MKSLILILALTQSMAAHAAPVTCTATCVLETKGSMVTVQGRGVDIHDAVIELKQSCDREAKLVQSPTHYLATSFQKPNATMTATNTEFDAQKACL